MIEADRDFAAWARVKAILHRNNMRIPFHEREIWWFAAGENIGSEINGKGVRFSRPVLIIRKYGPAGFFGAPLSSQFHEGAWYAEITNQGVKRTVLLSQAGSYSVNRLYGKMDRISKQEFDQICEKLKILLFKK